MIILVPNRALNGSNNNGQHNSGSCSEAVPLLKDLELIRLGKDLSVSVKLDKTHQGQLKSLDVEFTVPNLTLSVDTHSAQCLSALIASYLAMMTPASGTATTSGSGGSGSVLRSGGVRDNSSGAATVSLASKSIMQKVLMSDPTLRTLFWLEEEENRNKRFGGKKNSSSGRKVGDIGADTAGSGDDIDFARVAQLMRQVRNYLCEVSLFD